MWWAAGIMLVSALSSMATQFPQGHTYQGISQSNVFRRKPPAIEQVEPRSTPLPKIRLVGITTILGDKRALFKVLNPAQHGQSSNEESFIIQEGKKEGPIEVLRIDEVLGQAQIINSGTVMLLALEQGPVSSTPAP